MRTIRTVQKGNRTVRVRYNSEWQEYVCQLYIKGMHMRTDYHTDDKMDALQTAVVMARAVG